MGMVVRTKLDKSLKLIVEALKNYLESHPKSKVEIYRHNAFSVRIRIIDPDFRQLGRAEREDDLWAILDKLPEEVVSEVSLLLLLTPDEAKKSFANMEFDHPAPSKL